MTTHEEIRISLTKGCAEEHFEEMVCPKCSGQLKLCVHPDMRLFFVRCESDTTHLAMHGENDKPPSWWKDRVSGGWY